MSVHHIYCDESHLAPHPFRVQGGIWAEQTGMRAVRAELTALRARHPGLTELKWGKISGKSLLSAYRELTDVFFVGPASAHLAFKCMVIAQSDDASKDSDATGRDLGFYKAYWTLLRHRVKPGCTYHIRLDQRTSPRRFPEQQLQSKLQDANSRHSGEEWTIASCSSQCSKKEDLLQMADLFCGLVGWAWNGSKSTSLAKVQLAERVQAHLGWTTMRRSTSASSPKFNVWRYQPR